LLRALHPRGARKASRDALSIRFAAQRAEDVVGCGAPEARAGEHILGSPSRGRVDAGHRRARAIPRCRLVRGERRLDWRRRPESTTSMTPMHVDPMAHDSLRATRPSARW